MKTIIIEDETATVRNLKAILKNVAHEIDVVVTLDSVKKSVLWLSSNPHPDFIFMDIQLADGESFLIFNQVKIEAPVIFTTAYNEYALQAFKANGIDYLLKPLKQEELANAISKLKKFTNLDHNTYLKNLSQLVSQKSYINTLLIFYKDRIIPVDVETIAYFYSQNEKIQVRTFDGEPLPVDKSLNALMDTLCPEMFFRVNRQYIISRNAVKELNVWEGGRLSVILQISTQEQILISKEKVSEFKEWLQSKYYNI